MSRHNREWECSECGAIGRFPIDERVDTAECDDCGLYAVMVVGDDDDWLIHGYSVRVQAGGPLDAPVVRKLAVVVR